MLQTFVVTLREGVEAALIVAIILAYLEKIGRGELRRVVFAALAAALVASVGAAFALSRFNINQETFEGIVMLVAAFFVVTMIVFMARAAKTLKSAIEQRVSSFTSTGSQAGLFTFVFLMVFREGAETVLILSAISFNTSELLGFLGTLIGITLSVVFGVMFVRGTVRIDLGKFFRVTTVILIFVAVQLTISGLHELSESGVLPSTKRQMALIGPVVRNDVFFFITILALASLMVLFESRRRGASTTVNEATRAEQRKAVWTLRRERLWSSAVYVTAFTFIMLVTAQFIYAKATTSLSPAIPVEFAQGMARIDTADMQPGELRRYAGAVRGQEARFLIYKTSAGDLKTILDACAICGPVGFYGSGSQGITCKNCEAPINPEAIGESGGCNPIPLVATVAGGSVTVKASDLANSAAQIRE